MRTILEAISAPTVRSFVLLFGVLVAGPISPARAGVEPTPFIDWNQGYLLQGTSPLGDDPRVIFGFNPQPEPPVNFVQLLDLSDPKAPTIINTDGFGPGSFFDVYLAVGLPAVQLTLRPIAPGAPANGIGTLAFDVLGPTGAKVFDLFLDFLSESGGVMDSLNAVAFNPQPEPPHFFGPDSDYGNSFGFTSYSDVSVTLRMQDAQGNGVTFDQVPEPISSALICIGLAGLFAVRSRRRLAAA